jgi:glycerophosphoryl diester phosphodiesterase
VWRWIGGGAVAFAAFVFINNSNLLVAALPGKPTILAHRGIAQEFDRAGLRNDTCTAARMLPPKHAYLENTISSMRASFDAGAGIVEFDVHPTTDGQFAVFHDWTLDCRTDGHGVTRHHSMAQLKALDIGYGYTADGGRTFPFRGKGVGLMPSMDEVLAAFPGRRFLINVKSNDPDEGHLLALALKRRPAGDAARLMVYGGDAPVAAFRGDLPGVPAMSKGSLKACLLAYIGYGWSGLVPAACRNSLIFAPVNIAPWLWGWPNRFLDRMDRAGSSVFLVGPYDGGDFLSGIDTIEQAHDLPSGYSGGILTNDLPMLVRALEQAGN